MQLWTSAKQYVPEEIMQIPGVVCYKRIITTLFSCCPFHKMSFTTPSCNRYKEEDQYRSANWIFRCSSISWFEVVSQWVIDIFTASASMGLSDLFYWFLRILNVISVCWGFYEPVKNTLCVKMFSQSLCWFIIFSPISFQFSIIRYNNGLEKNDLFEHKYKCQS